jgi:hypothetical protein
VRTWEASPFTARRRSLGNRVEEAFLGVPARTERASITAARDTLLDSPGDRLLDGCRLPFQPCEFAGVEHVWISRPEVVIEDELVRIEANVCEFAFARWTTSTEVSSASAIRSMTSSIVHTRRSATLYASPGSPCSATTRIALATSST